MVSLTINYGTNLIAFSFSTVYHYLCLLLSPFSGSTLSIYLVGTWLQLSERFGPVIINVNRVAKDVGTIMLNYLVVLMAFSFGIYFVLKVNVIPLTSSLKDAGITMNENKNEEVSLFEIYRTLWWVLLNPGPDPDAFPDEGFAGTLSNVLFLTYQIFTIIMLLNLLIAMMNSTMQKIEDKRLTYWKYERTMLWITFIDQTFVIPPPFSIFIMVLQILFYLICGAIYLVWSLYRKCKNKKEVPISVIPLKDKTHSKSSKKYNCTMDPNEEKRRKRHATLLKKLLNNIIERELKSGKEPRKIKQTENSLSVE